MYFWNLNRVIACKQNHPNTTPKLLEGRADWLYHLCGLKKRGKHESIKKLAPAALDWCNIGYYDFMGSRVFKNY